MRISTNWMTVPETARYLSISQVTLYRMISKRKIPAHRIGKKLWRFSSREIDQWVKKKSNQKATR